MSDPNGLDLGPQLSALSNRVADWETILNRSVGELQGEMIRLTAAFDRLTEEFAKTRQALVNKRKRRIQ